MVKFTLSASSTMSVSAHSLPVAVKVIQLLLHVAAEAAPVVPVQPLPHDAHAVLALMFVECKVLNLGGDTTAPTGMDLFRQSCWRLGCPRHVLTGVRRKTGSWKETKKKNVGQVRQMKISNNS